MAATVFVIMPFDAAYDSVYSELIASPFLALGFVVKRADTDFNQRSILQDVVAGIAEATLVVADVSGLNSNVLYELGLAHALGKRTVMITRNIEELPFDLRPYKAISYSTEFTEAPQLKERLHELGQALLNGEANFSNPVQDYAPLSIGQASQISPQVLGNRGAPTEAHNSSDAGTESEHSDDDSDEDDRGLLDVVVDMQEMGDQTALAATKIGNLIEKLNESTNETTEKITRAQKQLGTRGNAVYLKIFREFAGSFNTFGSELKVLNDDLEHSVIGVATAATELAIVRTLSNADERDSLEQEVQSILDLELILTSSKVQITEFAESLLDLPKMQKDLTRAAKTAGQEVGRTAGILESASAELERARNLMNERLQSSSKFVESDKDVANP